jgi:uncharacterized protein
MPEYLSPGVYVEEVSSGPRPIEGVSTSTAGIVGLTERGPTRPRMVTSWGSFKSWFGDVVDSSLSFAPAAARGFFENGGQRLFVARVTRNGAKEADVTLPSAAARQGAVVTAMGPGTWGNRLFLRVGPGRMDVAGDPQRRMYHFTILYYREAPPTPLVDPFDRANINSPNRRVPDVVEDFDNLGALPAQADFFIARLTSWSHLIEVAWLDDSQPPAILNGTGGNFVQLDATAGTDGAAALVAADFEGDPQVAPSKRTGLTALAGIDEISILMAPDEVNPVVPQAVRTEITNGLVNQCEFLRERFAVLSLDAGLGDVSAQAFRAPRDTSYAAIYYPWIRVLDPRSSLTYLMPPVGHVAGIYARSDVERGVHKAPANEVVRGIVNRDINAIRKPLEYQFEKREQDILNPIGINVIRDFRGDRRDIRVWGARTHSSDPIWRYVNVRRLMLFIEESIDEGTQWVVFEPNDEPLWSDVRASVRNFLLLVWRSGALQGAREEDAFFVRCDRSTMTQADIDAGRLICDIGVAPVKPAEFVIFRISQLTASNSP